MQIHDLYFEECLSEDTILKRVTELAGQLNHDYTDKEPIFVCILNGSFMFFSDLLKHINLSCETSFLRVNSYENTSSSGNIKEILGLEINLENRHVIIIEDIVETGHTMQFLIQKLSELKAASVSYCTLLFKPDAYLYSAKIDYVGFEISNLFVVGYGLDYNEKGRNLSSIYVKID